MSNLELVMELVFANTETFKTLNPKQTINLLLTSKQINENEKIQDAQKQCKARYYARDMYYSVLETLEDACHFMKISRNTDACRERYNSLFNEADKMIEIISEYCKKDENICECLQMLIMAEYKENLYYYVYKSDPYMPYNVEIFYKSYFFEKLNICDKFTHIHNPSHYVFGEDEYYEFHEIEKEQKKSMVEIYLDAMNEKYGDYSDYDENDML